MEPLQHYLIGKLAERTGVSIETIRYYEKIGLLPLPARSEGGHRLYTDAHYTRLTSLRRCRALGFSIEEIRVLLSLVDAGDYTCGEIKEVTIQHLQNVQQKISDLQKLEQRLVDIAAQCEAGETHDCPVIETLFTAPS